MLVPVTVSLGMAQVYQGQPHAASVASAHFRDPWYSHHHLHRVCHLKGSVALSVVAGCGGVSRLVMIDVTELVRIVFSGLSALVIDDVEDAGEVICVRARTRGDALRCPDC